MEVIYARIIETENASLNARDVFLDLRFLVGGPRGGLCAHGPRE